MCKQNFWKRQYCLISAASKTAYFVRGQENIRTMNRPSPDLGSEGFMLMSMKSFWDFQPKDVLKFEMGKTGRLKAPAPGT